MSGREACMNKLNRIIDFNNRKLDFDDIVCELNVLLACDLKQILLMTPENRRLNVALAFANLNINQLADKSGLNDFDKNGVVLRRWIRHEYRLPLGAAFRLAKVFGVPVEVLFASPEWF